VCKIFYPDILGLDLPAHVLCQTCGKKKARLWPGFLFFC